MEMTIGTILLLSWLFVTTEGLNSNLFGYECLGGPEKWKIARIQECFWCYGIAPVQRMEQRTMALITDNYCKQHYDPESFPASIHSKDENDWLETHMVNGAIGLYQPGSEPWNLSLLEWSDKTPLNYQFWDSTYEPGTSRLQSKERMVKLRVDKSSHGWYDVDAKDVEVMICKKHATKQPNTSHLDGMECTGGFKWKIKKFNGVTYCYQRIRFPKNLPKTDSVISENYCRQTVDKDSFPASVHSKAENDFLEQTFNQGFIGLYQPGNGPWDPKLFRWVDGTKFDFQFWDKTAMIGDKPHPQPNNYDPIERLTKLRADNIRHGWHDFNSRGLDYIICKKRATKAPTPAKATCEYPPMPTPEPPIVKPKPTTTPRSPALLPMETLLSDDVPTSKPRSTCRV